MKYGFVIRSVTACALVAAMLLTASCGFRSADDVPGAPTAPETTVPTVPDTTETTAATSAATEAPTEKTAEAPTEAPVTEAPVTEVTEVTTTTFNMLEPDPNSFIPDPNAESGGSPSIPTYFEPVTDPNGNIVFSAEDEAFLEKTVFVGDSICSGLSVFGVLDSSHVVAKESISYYNIYNSYFEVSGGSYLMLDALAALKPENVVVWMGLNAISADTGSYASAFVELLGRIKSVLPNAKLYVVGVSPISSSATYTSNGNISAHNSAVAGAIVGIAKYVDIAGALQGEDGGLSANYDGGDGMHLRSSAYYPVLWQVCRNRY